MVTINKSINLIVTTALILIFAGNVFAQTNKKGFFVGYEILEMAMNEFQNFAGEIGYRFDEKNQVRLTMMEVKLTERHLSSKYEAQSIDGEDVEGYFRGYEVNYDRFFTKNWYISANIGYHHHTYEHTILDDEVENDTPTIGSGIGYNKSNLFGINHLYLNFSVPVRFYFNKIDETELGETTVRPHSIVNNIWLFLGYEF